MKANYSVAVKYGLIGGLILAAFSFITYIFYASIFGSLWLQMGYGLLAFAIMLFIPIWGGVTFKREHGGDITFAQAFTAVFIVFIISFAISSLVAYIIPNFIDQEYPERLYELVRDNTEKQMEKFNSTEEQIDKALEGIELEQFKPTPLRALKSFAYGSLFGLVVSLIIAIFVKRKSKTASPAPDTIDSPPVA